jgi:hypothetical protein
MFERAIWTRLERKFIQVAVHTSGDRFRVAPNTNKGLLSTYLDLCVSVSDEYKFGG